jgi:hypothetical protein
MAVVALPDKIQVEAEPMHMGLLGSCQREAAARRMGSIVDVHGFAGAIPRRDPFDLEGNYARDHG